VQGELSVSVSRSMSSSSTMMIFLVPLIATSVPGSL
jgi:hypothetical protein